VAILYSAAAGLLLAMLYAASPLTIWLIAALPFVFVLAGRGLPLEERRWLFVMLGVALLARAALIVAGFVLAIPQLNDMSVGGLAGDQAYNLGRALRTRDILLGFAHTRYDYFVALDEYGRSLYISLITWLQIALGPSPYSLRLLNVVWFVIAAAALFRTARNAFGPLCDNPKSGVACDTIAGYNAQFIAATAIQGLQCLTSHRYEVHGWNKTWPPKQQLPSRSSPAS